MNSYTQRPKSGKARRLWDALTKAGFDIEELHYNPNCWGRMNHANGWGTWAFTDKAKRNGDFGCWCGLNDKGVYIEGMVAPYARIYILPPN